MFSDQYYTACPNKASIRRSATVPAKFFPFTHKKKHHKAAKVKPQQLFLFFQFVNNKKKYSFQGLPWQKQCSTRRRLLFYSIFDLNLKKKLVKCYMWSVALCGAETGTVRAVDKKQLEGFEMWCWRRMEKISWTDRVRNEEVLLQVNEQRNILHAIRKRKANWIGHILRRNCLLKQVIERNIEGRIEGTRRRLQRRKQLFDDLKERTEYRKWKRNH